MLLRILGNSCQGFLANLARTLGHVLPEIHFGGEKPGHRQYQLAHVSPYLLKPVARQWPKVVQELLRHSSIKVTMDIYTQAVTSAKRKAQSRVVELIVPKPKPEVGSAHRLP